MGWSFGGTGTAINLAINESGNWHASGEGWHYCSPSAGDLSFLPRIRELPKAWWSVYPAGTAPAHVDIWGKGFSRYAEEHPGKTCGMISYSGGELPSLSFVIVAAKETGFLYYDLFKLIYAKPSKFEFQLDFLGLRPTSSDVSSIPTVEEFLNDDLFLRKPYLTHEVSLSLNQIDEQ